MRVAYLINQYPKVSHTFIRREILALERRGLDVLRIALRGWDDELVDDEDRSERELTRYVLKDGAVALLTAFVTTLMTAPRKLMATLIVAWQMSCRSERPLLIHLIYVAEACRIVSWLREAKVEHLHAHFGTNSAEIAMMVHALGGPGWSFTVHGPEEFDKAPLIGLARKIHDATFVVAISSYGKSQLYRLADHYHWQKIHVVHCGIEPAFYASINRTCPAATRRLVCVGRLCEQKGQSLLIEAARRLAAEGVEFELVLAGDGEMRNEIEALISSHGLEDRIRITGWISSNQVRDELLAARALVLPSFAEGLPVVLMEAMSLCRPVISTFVAGIPEIVLPGINGWLVPAGDVEALSSAMKTCLEATDEDINRFGSAAQRPVLQHYNVDIEAVKLAELFNMNCTSTITGDKQQ
jgi:colanic acid/amylovoran biosynthesis glycosyltransferase